jgi:hypothetical protein
MNAKRSVLFSIAVVILLARYGAAQDVRYNYDKTEDFSKFKSYAWVALKDAPKLNDITDKEIKAAVDKDLASKGLTQVEPDKADLLVAMQAAVGHEQQFTSYSTGWGYGPGWYGGGWYGPSGNTTTGQTSTIYTGQLTLDFYDAAKHDLVWRGVASKTIDPKAKPDKQKKNIDKAVAKLLKNYPPPQKKS